jgi:hypothetical protein
VSSWENLLLASSNAARGKRQRPDVEEWLLREETGLMELREGLLGGSYQPGPYRFFEIYEPKRRVIAAAPFRDRVVHHALCQFMAPVLERRFIARSFSCQIGKGTTAARDCCRKLVNRHAYVLKCDVRKFFPNIDHAILRSRLDGVSRCGQVMGLIGALIGSHRTGDDIPPSWFGGDELLDGTRARGLPIGNLTSQLWGNFYLDGLVHWATEAEQHGDYLRYTDDFLLFSDDKARLWDLRAGIVGQLAEMRLKLAEPKSRLLATGEGVPFCGFRFLPGMRPRILGPTKRRFERRRRLLAGRRDFRRLTRSVFAWFQFSREGNSEGLRRAYCCLPLATRLERRQRGTSRVLRGAAWNNNNPDNLLSSNRNNNNPDNRNNNIGFRCVLVGGGSLKATIPGEVSAEHLASPSSAKQASLSAAPVPR